MTEKGHGAHLNGHGVPGVPAGSLAEQYPGERATAKAPTPRNFTRSAVDVLAFERYIADSEGQAAAQSGVDQPQSPYMDGGDGNARDFWLADTADRGADVLGCLEPQKRGIQGEREPMIPAKVRGAQGPVTDHPLQWFNPLASFSLRANQADGSVPKHSPANSPKVPAARRKTLVSSDLIIKGSPARSQKPVNLAEPQPIGLPPILSGFDPETLQESLRFGDTITIIPDNANGLVAFAGADDARPWLEILDDTHGQHVAMPPNLRDCQWRILPAPLYVEQKKLLKMLSTSN